MSRGWESKDVESQQAERESARRSRKESQVPLNPEIESLLMSRTRVMREIETTQHPKRKQQLQAALAHLNAQIAKLGGAG